MIKNFFKTEWNKLKVMSFRDKRQYIWEYYKLHIIFGGIAIAILGSIINTVFINPPRREYLYIAWAGSFILPAHLEALEERLEVIVSDPERYLVRVTSYAPTENLEMDMALQQRFFAMISVGAIDLYVISSEEHVHGVAEFGLIRPIYDVVDAMAALDPVFHAKMLERLVVITYIDPEGDGEAKITNAMAVSLEGSPLLEATGLWSDGLYVGFVSTSTRHYESAKALREFLR